MKIIVSLILPVVLLSCVPYASSSSPDTCTDDSASYSSVNMLMGTSLCGYIIQQDVTNAMNAVCSGAGKRADEQYKNMVARLQALEKSIDDLLSKIATLKLSTGLRLCRAGYEYYREDQLCYKFYSDCKNWTDARKVCQQDGGDLISLKDGNFNFFRDVIRSKAGACNHVWVGTTDAAVEGDWKWLNGAVVGTGFWQPRQPDNWDNKEHCGDLKSPDYLLNDENCSLKLHFVCQIA